jgi:mRNA interferase YafQ
MNSIHFTGKYQKDYALAAKRGYDLSILDHIVCHLANNEILDVKHKDHKLAGDYTGYRECHITPDWLLIYKKDTDNKVLSLARTGTHSDLY